MILGNIKELPSKDNKVRRFELNGEIINVQSDLIEQVTLYHAIGFMISSELLNWGYSKRRETLKRFKDEISFALNEAMARLAQ